MRIAEHILDGCPPRCSCYYFMPLQAQLHPPSFSLHTHIPRFDDGSLPPRRVSTGRRSNYVPFPLSYLLRSLVTPRFHRDLSRLSSLKLTTYREIFYLYPWRDVSPRSPPRCTYVIRGRMPASGVFIALAPAARCFPSFLTGVPSAASLLVISFETGKPARGKETSAGSPVDSNETG